MNPNGEKRHSFQNAIVIGGGIGGLTTGILLARSGIDVTIVEKHDVLGGYLQGFSRRGVRFETGLHYLGGCMPGHPMSRYLKLLGVYDDLSFIHSSDDSIVKLIFPNQEKLVVPRGTDHFSQTLKDKFPEDAKAIDDIKSMVNKCIGALPWLSFCSEPPDFPLYQEYSILPVVKAIDGKISNPMLRNILYSFCFDSSLKPEVCPFLLFSMVFYSGLISRSRIRGGSINLVNVLEHRFLSLGGKIIVKNPATNMIVKEKSVKALELSDGSTLNADVIVSTCHPLETVRIAGRHNFSPSFINNLDTLVNGPGSFKVYLELSKAPEIIDKDGWLIIESDPRWDRGIYLLSPSNIDSSYGNRHTLEIFTWEKYASVDQWSDSTCYNRPREYIEYKEKFADALIARIETEIPGLRKHIKHCYTSTSLTNLHFTRSAQGAAMGISQDVYQQGVRHIRPRNRIRNLFLAGQSVGTPGILGTIIHSAKLVNDILGDVDFLEEMMSYNF